MSAARALWLLGQLGEGSAVGAAVAGGPEFRAWTTSTILAAYSLNALNGANWQRSGGKKSRPKPIEPPKPKSADGRSKKKAPNALQRRIAQQAALQRAQVQRGGLGVPEQDTATQD